MPRAWRGHRLAAALVSAVALAGIPGPAGAMGAGGAGPTASALSGIGSVGAAHGNGPVRGAGPVRVAGRIAPRRAVGADGVTLTDDPGVPIMRFDGSNRYDTARKLAITTFNTADTVVLASGGSFPDALSGSYLAGHVNGPILLTDPTHLSPETASALATLGTRRVLVVGGLSAISADVTGAIASMVSTNAAGGLIVVDRLDGVDRYDTDKLVAETPPPSSVGSVAGERTGLLASGMAFPDALAGGPLAFAHALPMILTDPATLSPQAARIVGDLCLRKVLILGGPHAISPAIEAGLTALGVEVERLAGDTRTATAAAIANFAGLNLGFGAPADVAAGQPPGAQYTHLNLARGDNAGGGADALALGPVGGYAKVPILLTTSADEPSVDVTKAVVASTGGLGGPSTLVDVHIAGGLSAVSAAVEQMVTVDSGGGPLGAMTISPTAAKAMTVVTASSVDKCPAAPAGSAAQVEVVLVAQNGVPGSLRGPSVAIPIAGGGWSVRFLLPTGALPGQYLPVAFCLLSFADGYLYPYATEIGPIVALS